MPCRHVSLTFNITRIKCHSETLPKPPRQVAPLRHATRATSPDSTGEHTPGRVVYRGVYIILGRHSNIKSAGFAFPGDVSLTAIRRLTLTHLTLLAIRDLN